jgi:lysophospholipase L1-like esterase
MSRSLSHITLVIASVALALALFEGGLRIANFRFDVGPASIEFGWPNPEQLATHYEPDPLLFWVPENYSEMIGRIEELGAHIVFLGDSCTAVGAYPKLLTRQLLALHPGIGLRAVKIGVSGWTTHQGLRQLERDVLPAQPRIVTIFYGWNDHWVGFGIEDKEIDGIRLLGIPGLASMRTVQLVFKGLVAWRASRRGDRPNRVSIADFRENLRRMVRLARESDVVPVLLTAPTSHREGAEPAILAKRHVRDLDELVPMHAEYVQIVRDVAAAEGAVLCDLAAAFDTLPEIEVRFDYFRRDGIHLRQRGDEKIAELLLECFAASEEVSAALVPLAR